MSVTLDDLSTILNDISDTCTRIMGGLTINGSQVVVTEGLSDISGNLGMVIAGEFRSGTGTPGNITMPFTGVRIGSPGWTYNSKKYSIVGLNAGVLQFGLSNEDGSIYAGDGAIQLNADGLIINGEGSTDQNKRIKFYYDSSGTLFPTIQLYSDYGTPGGNMTGWMDVRRNTSSPWSDAKLGLRVIDQIAPRTVTFSISSNGDVVVGGGTYFQVGDGMSTRAIEGLSVGYASDPSKGNVAFSGELISRKNNSDVAVYGFHPLLAPLTSTSWDGDAFSTTAKTKIDLSAVFGVPAGIKAVQIRAWIRDSGSAGASNAWILLGPTDTANEGAFHIFVNGLPNDSISGVSGLVPCNSDGDIYYQISATGSGTMDVYIEVWGYWI